MSTTMNTASAAAATTTTVGRADTASFPLLHLPAELARRTVSFLSPLDAVRLSRCCKALHVSLSLRTLQPHRPLLFRQRTTTTTTTRIISTTPSIGTNTNSLHVLGQRGPEGDEPQKLARIPVFNRRVHSITLTLRWRDQQWGNRKGQLYLVTSRVPIRLSKHVINAASTSAGSAETSHPNDVSNNNNNNNRNEHAIDGDTGGLASTAANEFRGARVIYTSPLAPHDEDSLQITFSPVEGEMYHLWCRVGGGGGHELFLGNCWIRTMIFDDEYGTVSHNYQQLHAHGALGADTERAPHHTTTEEHVQPNQPRRGTVGGATTSTTSGGGAATATGRLRPTTFYTQMLLRVSRSLRRQLIRGGILDEDLVALFQEYEIGITEASLLALEEIVQDDLEQHTLDLSDDEEEERWQREHQRQRQERQREFWRHMPMPDAGDGVRRIAFGGEIPNDVLMDFLGHLHMPDNIRAQVMGDAQGDPQGDPQGEAAAMIFQAEAMPQNLLQQLMAGGGLHAGEIDHLLPFPFGALRQQVRQDGDPEPGGNNNDGNDDNTVSDGGVNNMEDEEEAIEAIEVD